MKSDSRVLAVLCCLLVIAAVGAATTGVVQDTGDEADDAFAGTDLTTIDESVDDATISDADADGVQHVAYTTAEDDAIHYASVGTDGEVSERTTVTTVEGTLEQFSIVAGPDRAHVVWNEERTNSEETSGHVVRATVEDGTVTGTYDALSKTMNRTESYRLEDVAIDDRGDVHALYVHEDCPHPDYEYMVSVITFDGESDSHEETLAYQFETTDGYTFGAGVDVRDGRLVVGLSSGDFHDRTVRAHEYDVTDDGLEQVAERELAEGERGTVRDVVVHPDGTGIVSHTTDDGGLDASDGERLSTQWFETGLWTDERLFALRTDTYVVYDADGATLAESAPIDGFEDWGVDGDDHPAVVRLVDGELRYGSLPAVDVSEEGDSSDSEEKDEESNSSDDDGGTNDSTDGTGDVGEDGGNDSDDDRTPWSGWDENDLEDGEDDEGDEGEDETNEDEAAATPGFGVGVAVIALLVVATMARLRQ